MKNTLVLIILDGWGVGEKNEKSNPFVSARMPAIEYIEKYFPAGTLRASGIAVGLPWEEPGSSEVGHLTLGSGRIIYQAYPKISMSIKNGDFFKNKTLNQLFEDVKKRGAALHLSGLLSSSHIHSAYDHLIALLELAKEKGLKEVYLHLFGDGQDSPPQDGLRLLKKLSEDLKQLGVGEIASLSGRSLAMDRTRNWEKTKKVYDLLTEGKGKKTNDIIHYLEEEYKKGINDSSIEPVIVGKSQEGKLPVIKDGDGLFIFNFREDRIKQLFLSLTEPEFSFFERKIRPKAEVATMVEYLKNSEIPFAFSLTRNIQKTLGEILSERELIQLKIAETEKYPLVTYFFNGLRSEPFFGEERILIPSYLHHQFEAHPEMRAKEITDRALQALDESAYNFILVNYANGDAIGHTGNFPSAIKALESIDSQISRLLKIVLKEEHVLLITADHGNVECLRSPFTGEEEKGHTTNPVPVFLVGKNFARLKRESFSLFHAPESSSGILSDIAPTILELMSIKKPKEMSGESLLGVLR